MNVSGRAVWQLQVFSLVILIIPMIVYPSLLGTELQKFVPTHILYELLFYFIVTFVLFRQVTFSQAIQISLVCIIYRLILSSLFAFLLAALHSMPLNVSFTMGMYSYLPALLLHIIAAPLILKPVMDGVYSEKPNRRTIPQMDVPINEAREMGKTSVAYSKERKGGRITPRPIPKYVSSRRPLEHGAGKETLAPAGEINGFDKATKWVGEDSSVKMAAVIDHEGLLLSNFGRGDFLAEDIVPHALTIMESCSERLNKIDFDSPERVDFLMHGERVVIALEKNCCFMVIAERRSDDLLNIRINQALEMLRKYMSERYSPELRPAMERTYA
jgi:hypothetical protein